MLKFCQGYVVPQRATDILNKVPHTTQTSSQSKHVTMKTVQLHKDPVCGLGMVISCGNTYETLLHGAFVECVHPGGPAEQVGNICAGDQILSVNGIDVRNDYYLDVVDLIKCSNSPVELAFGKPDSTLSPYSQKEVIERAVLGLKSLHSVQSLIENSTAFPDTPVPKPRKKYMEREKKQDQLNLDTPDITMNHTNNSPDKKWTESDHNMINKHFTIENCNIPDIIASQIKHLPDQHLNGCKISNEQTAPSPEHFESDNYLLPGEVYHVVLDKKGGSLGLNIYQGIDSSCSKEKHIYIHSIIPNGAAETDGRIKPGDKLLEVNGVMLDNLSYQEVVTKLRESPQVAHLVLEKGDLFEIGQEDENIRNITDKAPERRIQNSMSLYKSTPNLAENSDEEDKLNTSGSLYRNRSTDCLLYSPHFMNPHQALFELYRNYACNRGSSSNIHQIPAVPIRKKKLKRLEDICNYSNSDNTFLVRIRKSSRGLGLSISGGRDAAQKDIFSQLIQVRKLYPLQPALECGKLALGDVLLEANGISMIGLTNTEALEVLRSAPSEVLLKVFRPSKSLIPSFSLFKGGFWPFFDSSSSSASSSLSRTENNSTYNVETGEFEITLVKREGSLGFTISRKEKTGDNTPEGIYVKALVREPAVSDGRIQPGDRILQVNGTTVSSMSNAEAIEFIRNTPDTVTLKLFREDPPLTPGNFEDEYTITKPLRWEAVELLNDRVKHKEVNNPENGNLNRKIKRKIGRLSNAPSSSSTESTSSSSSSGQEHLIDESLDESMELCGMSEELYMEGGGLQRNQRPKSLDVLNSSERKRLTGFGNDDSFHRQSSVMCPTVEVKTGDNSENDSNTGKKGKNLLKWRGHTLPDSEESSSPEILYEVSTDSLDNPSSQVLTSSTTACDEEEDSDDRPIPFPRSTSYANEWVHTFDVDLDRGWHGRLGFSLCDPKDESPESPRNKLPIACEVKAVYPVSIADKDGRIKVGDRLVEVNRECMLRKPASEVIDILRKTRGVIRMVFCRLIQRP
ncbi:multiple PDZ domain protein-like [Uloborus diversus]|uniref:multiple PDZ domain protein-like n=1 Tax=Uloborus diversus TaxID=327109 RepID=UPI002409E208|nr:multiple PDZ domain protein-like [Uloborus diversus]